MRYIIFILILFFGFIFTINAHDTSEPHAEPLESYGDVVIDNSVQEQVDMPELLKKAISIIMTNQQVTNINDINKEQISDADLEMLGDVLLEISNPGEAHVEIHKQNGGEGLEELKLFHINTAKSYLGLKIQDYTKNTESDSTDINIESTAPTNTNLEPNIQTIQQNLLPKNIYISIFVVLISVIVLVTLKYFFYKRK